jgi:ABC-type multidrug transport system ATPase subunit
MTALDAHTLLHLQGVSFGYPDQSAVLRNWSVRIGPGVTLLHGDAGSGKSTALRVMAAAVAASGELTLAAQRLADDAAAYRRQVFYCDPDSDRCEGLTARECTQALGAGDAGFSTQDWHQLVRDFALGPHLDKPMYALSTGTQRKLWLAAALASGRALVLLDEPTAALDAPSVQALWQALMRCAARPNQAVVVASAQRLTAVWPVATIELPVR